VNILQYNLPIIPVKVHKDEDGKYSKKPLCEWSCYIDNNTQTEEEREKVLEGLEKGEYNGVAVVCGHYVEGKGYFFAIDIDLPNQEALKKLSEIPNTTTCFEKTVSGNLHAYYFSRRPVPSFKLNGSPVELKGRGSLIVIHPSENYEALNDNTPREVEDGYSLFHEICRAFGVDFDEHLAKRAGREFAEPDVLEEWLNEIKAELLRLGLNPQRGPNYYTCLCPFHKEKHPSFAINFRKYYAVDYHDGKIYNMLELMEALGLKLERPKKNEEHAEQDFEIKPLSQLVSEAKPIEWIVENLIPRHGLVILAGKAGVGKSMVTLHLSHAVVNGEPLFGAFPIQNRGGVLIIDNENYPGLYLQRVRALGLNPLEGIDTLNLTDFSIDSRQSIEWLEKALAEKKYALVVLDSWTNLIRNTDENKAPEVGKVLSRLRKIAYEHGCCFVLIHHLRKNMPYAVDPKDELRGSSTLMNEADLVIAMQVSREDGLRNLRTIKQRYGKEVAVELRFVENDGRLVLQGREIATAEAESKVEKAIRDIVKYLADIPHAVSRRELIKNLPYSESTIKRALYIAVKMGKVVHIGRGLYSLPAKLGLEQFG
jgi:signal recognition particle subunit SEC65